MAAEVSAGWILDNDGAERGALLRRGSFQCTPKFESGGLVLEDEGFAKTKLVIGTNAIVSPNNVLRISTPAGPIPIPVPNRSTATKSG